MAGKQAKTKVPKNLQPVFWSADVDKLDVDKHKKYIIHQLLMYGSFSELRWLFTTYGRGEVIDVFLNHPVKQYPKIVYHFVKNYLLGLEEKQLDEQNYITSISGPLRQRASGGFSQA